MTRDRLVLVLSGAALLAAFAAVAAAGELHRRIPLLFILYGSAFGAYVVGVRIALRTAPTDRWILALMFGVAIAARAVLIPSEPALSTDIYRYAWEGRVVLHGVNPFAVVPADSSLALLRDADFTRISHRHMATIYPPLAQGVFALSAWICPGVTTLKALFVLFDIGTIVALVFLLRARGRPPVHALVYAWSPLVILETGHSGHLDAVGVFFLVAGVTLLAHGRRWTGHAAFAASFLAKFITVALLPYFVARRHWKGIALAIVLAAAGYLPFIDAGPRLLDSLLAYGSTWWFNGPPFMALAGILDDPGLGRRLLAGAGIAFAIAAGFRERDLVRCAYLVLGCALLLSPTVYPWYLIWIVPFLCVFPGRAWIAFTGLVVLSYWVWVVQGQAGLWMLPTGVIALEYVPCYALLAWGALRRREPNAEQIRA